MSDIYVYFSIGLLTTATVIIGIVLSSMDSKIKSMDKKLSESLAHPSDSLSPSDANVYPRTNTNRSNLPLEYEAVSVNEIQDSSILAASMEWR